MQKVWGHHRHRGIKCASGFGARPFASVESSGGGRARTAEAGDRQRGGGGGCLRNRSGSPSLGDQP